MTGALSSVSPSNLLALLLAFVAASNVSMRFLCVALATDFLISQWNRCLLKRSIFSGSVTHGCSPVSIFISSVYRYMYSCNVSFGLCALAIRCELRCCFVCKFEKFSLKASLQSSHDVVGGKLLIHLNTAPSDFAVASSLLG